MLTVLKGLEAAICTEANQQELEKSVRDELPGGGQALFYR